MIPSRSSMFQRSLYLLAVLFVFVLTTTAESQAKSPSVAIVDLGPRQAAQAPLLGSIGQDLSVAGYELKKDAELEDGLQGPVSASPLPAAAAFLEDAQSAYEGFEFDKALKSLRSTSELLSTSLANEDARELLAQKYLLAGLIRVAQERPTKAINNFRLAHRLSPSLSRLDAGSHRPSVVKLYDDAVKQNRSARPARVERLWTPKNAVLYVDGRKVKKNEALTQGPHILTVEADGYASESLATTLSEKNSHAPTLNVLSLTKQLEVERRRAATSKQAAPKRFRRLTELADVDVLVLLLNSSDGVRAALYYRADQSLSSWVQPGSVRWQSLLSRDNNAVASKVIGPAKRKQEQAPWFKTWWGGGLLVGGTAVVGTALYFALSASDSSEMGVTIDQWCFGTCN